MTILEMQYESWKGAAEKGFHTSLDNFPEREQTLIRLALIHTEVSEATQEAKRHGITSSSADRIAEELADVLIRVGDLAGCLKVDLEEAVVGKLKKNSLRPFKFGTPEEGKNGEVS